MRFLTSKNPILAVMLFFIAATNSVCANEIDFMAIGDSAWVEGKAAFGDKDSTDIHPGLEGIFPLRSSDINFINLEASVSTGCERFIPKPYTFAVGKKTVLGFASWGFNMFALANNHSIDCAKPSVDKTVDAGFKLTNKYLKNVVYHGVASTPEKLLKPAIREIRGLKVGLISIKVWNDKKRPYLGNNLNHEKLFESLKNHKVDFRILSIHGGTERSRVPDPEIVKLSRKFITDYSGDLVLGHHPHVVSGLELFKRENGRNALIIYSLGNGLHNGINGLNGDGKVVKLKLNTKEGVKTPTVHPLRSNAFRLNPAPSERIDYFKSQIYSSSKLVSPFKHKSIKKLQTEFTTISEPTPGFEVKSF
ncbi:CapA family protein [bacterium]|nr:CapA family protein [bacterium]